MDNFKPVANALPLLHCSERHQPAVVLLGSASLVTEADPRSVLPHHAFKATFCLPISAGKQLKS